MKNKTICLLLAVLCVSNNASAYVGGETGYIDEYFQEYSNDSGNALMGNLYCDYRTLDYQDFSSKNISYGYESRFTFNKETGESLLFNAKDNKTGEDIYVEVDGNGINIISMEEYKDKGNFTEKLILNREEESFLTMPVSDNYGSVQTVELILSPVDEILANVSFPGKGIGYSGVFVEGEYIYHVSNIHKAQNNTFSFTNDAINNKGLNYFFSNCRIVFSKSFLKKMNMRLDKVFNSIDNLGDNEKVEKYTLLMERLNSINTQDEEVLFLIAYIKRDIIERNIGKEEYDFRFFYNF